MSNLAIISSGDPEKDAKELERAVTFDERIKAGLCPNGCAMMGWSIRCDPKAEMIGYRAECPKCHFLYSTNVPYGKEPENGYEQ